MIIKEYKRILIIELKDWTKLRSEKTKEELAKYLEYVKNHSWICDIDWTLFDRYEFKKAYEETLDSIEGYITSFTKDIEEKLRQRQKEKKSRLWKGFESINEIDNWLKEKWLVALDD